MGVKKCDTLFQILVYYGNLVGYLWFFLMNQKIGIFDWFFFTEVGKFILTFPSLHSSFIHAGYGCGIISTIICNFNLNNYSNYYYLNKVVTNYNNFTLHLLLQILGSAERNVLKLIIPGDKMYKMWWAEDKMSTNPFYCLL